METLSRGPSGSHQRSSLRPGVATQGRAPYLGGARSEQLQVWLLLKQLLDAANAGFKTKGRAITLALFLPPPPARNPAHDSGYTARLRREPGSSRAPPRAPSSPEPQGYGSPLGGEPCGVAANLGRGRDRGVRSATERGSEDGRGRRAAGGAGRGKGANCLGRSSRI